MENWQSEKTQTFWKVTNSCSESPIHSSPPSYNKAQKRKPNLFLNLVNLSKQQKPHVSLAPNCWAEFLGWISEWAWCKNWFLSTLQIKQCHWVTNLFVLLLQICVWFRSWKSDYSLTAEWTRWNIWWQIERERLVSRNFKYQDLKNYMEESDFDKNCKRKKNILELKVWPITHSVCLNSKPHR